MLSERAQELEKQALKVADYRYWRASVAETYAKRVGLTVEIVGDPDGVVYKQYPEAGTVIEKASGKIIFYTDKNTEPEMLSVPDVTGMTAVAANQTLVNAGFNIRIKGTKNYLSGTGATVISQSVEKGTLLPRGSVIEVTFRYLDDTNDGDY